MPIFITSRSKLNLFAKAAQVRAANLSVPGALSAVPYGFAGFGETIEGALNLETGEMEYEDAARYTEEEPLVVEGSGSEFVEGSGSEFDQYIAEQSAASEASRGSVASIIGSGAKSATYEPYPEEAQALPIAGGSVASIIGSGAKSATYEPYPDSYSPYASGAAPYSQPRASRISSTTPARSIESASSSGGTNVGEDIGNFLSSVVKGIFGGDAEAGQKRRSAPRPVISPFPWGWVLGGVGVLVVGGVVIAVASKGK